MNFGFVLRLNQREREVLERAIHHYRSVCRREVRKGGSVPFIAHQMGLRRLLRRLNTKQTKLLGYSLADREAMILEEVFKTNLNACKARILDERSATLAGDAGVVRKLQKRMRAAFKRAFIDYLDWAKRMEQSEGRA
jgi:hypothetical protein